MKLIAPAALAGAVWLAGCTGYPAGPGNGTGARVTFVIDDGHETDYTVKKPIFDAHGAVAVAAVPSRIRELTDAQLLEMQADGWEIADHGATHRDETTLTDAELEVELADSKADLESLGLRVETHVYPYGSADARVKDWVRRYYRAGVLAVGGLNREPIADSFALTRMVFGNRNDSLSVPPNTLVAGHTVGGPLNLEWYQSQVDRANQEGAWLIFNVHELTPVSAWRLDQLLSYIKGRGIPIVTIRQGQAMP